MKKRPLLIVLTMVSLFLSSCSSSSSEESSIIGPSHVLKFVQDEIKLNINSTFDLNNIVTTSYEYAEINYSSENNAIATISGSTLTTLAVGTTNIVASAHDKTISTRLVILDPNEVIITYEFDLKGNGSESSPYLIETATDLKKLSVAVLDYKDFTSKYFKQINDISLAEFPYWTPIGTFGVPFEGIYDGNDKTVSDLFIDTTDSWQGLFGFASGVIKNVTVEGSVRVSIPEGHAYSHSFAAGVCGGIYNNALIENCINKANVHGDAYVGGINGGIARSDEMIVKRQQSEIKGCKNYGTITGNDTNALNENAMYFGGICGESLGVLTNNENYGDVIVSGPKTQYIGGICGLGYTIYKYGMYKDEDLDLYANRGNKNFGNVTGNHSVGGIFGSNVLPVYDSINEGDITGNVCVGGISGLNGTRAVSDNASSVAKLENCINYGAVHAEDRYAGGVTSTTYFDVINCHNEGVVTTGESAYYAGGVVGYQSSGNVINCTNKVGANVKGYYGVGGVVGWSNKGYLNIENCINYADVSCFDTNDLEAVHIGGVVGMLGSTNEVNYCENYGEVKGHGTRDNPSRWGGIGGVAGSIYSASKISYSRNHGKVIGNQQVGGIAGYVSGSDATIVKYSINMPGALIYSESTEPHAGGIIGRANNGTYAFNENYGALDVINATSAYSYLVASTNGAGLIRNINYYDPNNPTQEFDIPDLVKTSTIQAFSSYFSGGTGFEDDPFIIKTTQDFELLKARCESNDDNYTQANVYYRLENDISVSSSINIGNTENTKARPFKGVFDGNNHSITIINAAKNSSINIALFGTNEGIIKNLTLKGIIQGYHRVGGICVYNFGTIENCVNEAEVIGDGIYIGGITAINGDNVINKVGKIINCHNNGLITSTYASAFTSSGQCVGGIVGFGYAIAGTSILNCVNRGTISGVSGLGGIVGFYREGATITGIENCYNFGKVEGHAPTQAGELATYSGHIGGIVGRIGTGTNLTNCANYGEVSGNSGKESKLWRGVGGIVGSIYATTITNCFNAGNVSAYYMAGGIVGYSESNSAKIIDNCVSTGTISVEHSDAGGILGRGNYTTITNCTNAGVINGNTNPRAIYGTSNSGTTTNCNIYYISDNALELVRIITIYSALNCFESENPLARILYLESNLTGTNDTEFMNTNYVFDKTDTFTGVLVRIKTELEEGAD
ncbi:MAG: The GLUG motif protein [Tenericutes bacterium ADurb.Bin087]|nr:MAG: The GLUG motif protein [Tenericutes bacterium ADurb.Bin087]